jgi:hypothetical protein
LLNQLKKEIMDQKLYTFIVFDNSNIITKNVTKIELHKLNMRGLPLGENRFHNFKEIGHVFVFLSPSLKNRYPEISGLEKISSVAHYRCYLSTEETPFDLHVILTDPVNSDSEFELLQHNVNSLFPWDLFKTAALSQNYLPSKLTDTNVTPFHLNQTNRNYFMYGSCSFWNRDSI